MEVVRTVGDAIIGIAHVKATGDRVAVVIYEDEAGRQEVFCACDWSHATDPEDLQDLDAARYRLPRWIRARDAKDAVLFGGLPRILE